MRVYVIFDPAGIWELGEPIYASREEAERVIAAHPPQRTGFGMYSLRIVEYEVQE